MLRKLLKYELSATSRLILPLYLAIFVVTVLNRIVLSIDVFEGTLAIIPGSITAIYIISLVGILAVTLLYMVTRFYKNLMTDEGYLMFTIPVNSHQLTLSKLFASLIWMCSTVIVILVSLVIVLYTPDRMTMLTSGFNTILSEFQFMFGKSQTTILLIEFSIYIVIGVIYGILMIYFSIAIGQLFNGHKIIGSFGAYIAIYTIMQILSAISFIVMGSIYKTNLNNISSLYNLILPLSISLTLVLCILYYIGIQFIFNKKLNLD